jgi:hypothetical protein
MRNQEYFCTAVIRLTSALNRTLVGMSESCARSVLICVNSGFFFRDLNNMRLTEVKTSV